MLSSSQKIKFSQHQLTFFFSIFCIISFLISVFYQNPTFSTNESISIAVGFIFFYLLFFLEKKKRNSFLEILNIFFLVFFLFRASTISHFSFYEYSFLKEYNLITENFFKYVLILNFQYLLFGLALILVPIKFKNFNFEIKNDFFVKKTLCVLFFFIVSLSVYYSIYPIYQEYENLRILKIFFYLFNFDKIMIISIFLLFYTRYELLNKYKYFILLIIFCSLTIPVYLSGTKSTVFEFLLLAFLFYQLRKDKIFKLRHLFLILSAIILAIIFFFIAKVIKSAHLNEVHGAGFVSYIEIYNSINFSQFINSFIYRISFFDNFFLFSQNKIYEEVINITYIFKSLIDRITPFYDFFNVPLLSRAVYNLIEGINLNVNSSMQITLFAEAYILFKNFSFLFYLFLAGIFKFILFAVSKYIKDYFAQILINFFLIKNYFYYLIGYGFDTFAMGMVYDVTFLFITFVSLFLFYKIYNNEPKY